MNTERIRMSPHFSCQAGAVNVPDIRYIGLMVTKKEQRLIEMAYTAAQRLHGDILKRDRLYPTEVMSYEIDVPDLSTVGKLVQSEKNELAAFTEIFRALVEHFLPDAQMTGYSLRNHTPGGVRYQGLGWTTK